MRKLTMINMSKIELMNRFMEYIEPFKEWVEKGEGPDKKDFIDKWNSKSEDVDCMEEKQEPPTFDVQVHYVRDRDYAILKAYAPSSDEALFDLVLNAYFAFDSELMEISFTCRIAP